MPERFVASHIRRIPLFQQLPDDTLAKIVPQFAVLRFNANDVVVAQGQATQGFFMLASGGGRLLRQQPDGTTLTVGLLADGQAIGEEALFRMGAESVTLQITEPSVVLFLSFARMQSLLAYYPEIRAQLLPETTTAHEETAPPPIRPQARGRNDLSATLKRPNEEVILVCRRHPWSFVRRGWLAVLTLVFAGAVAVFLFTVSDTAATATLISGFVLSALMMLYFFLEWRNDSIVITDQRVIQIERVIPTFSVTINEMPLDSVQEVNTSLPDGDWFARILDYGDIELRNAGDTGNLVLDTVPDPEGVQDAIFSKRKRRQEEADQNRRNQIRADIEKQLGLDGAATHQDDAPQSSTMSNQTRRSFSIAATHFTNSDGETVIRKHVTVWLSAVLAPTFVIISGLVIMVLALVARNTLPWMNWVGLPLGGVLIIAGGLWFWWSDWDWRNDLYIIGDEKITIIHKRPMWLQNEVEQILLERVDNVFSQTNGPVDMLFKRGNVQISLIGEGMSNAKTFYKIHRPHEVQAEISRRQARARDHNAHHLDQQQREAISEYLSVYHETLQPQQAQQPPPQSPPPENAPRATLSPPAPYRSAALRRHSD